MRGNIAMMTDGLRQEIAELLNVDVHELVSDRALSEFESWDSVAILSLTVMLSDSLGREITPAEVALCRTIGDVEHLVDA